MQKVPCEMSIKRAASLASTFMLTICLHGELAFGQTFEITNIPHNAPELSASIVYKLQSIGANLLQEDLIKPVWGILWGKFLYALSSDQTQQIADALAAHSGKKTFTPKIVLFFKNAEGVLDLSAGSCTYAIPWTATEHDLAGLTCKIPYGHQGFCQLSEAGQTVCRPD